MDVECEGVLDALLPHQRKARGIHEAEGVIRVSVHDLVRVTLKMLGHKDPFELGARGERVQKATSLAVSLGTPAA